MDAYIRESRKVSYKMQGGKKMMKYLEVTLNNKAVYDSHIVELLKSLKKITMAGYSIFYCLNIDLSENHITCNGLKTLLKFVFNNIKSVGITILKLYKNNIRDEGAALIKQLILQQKVPMEELHLSHNYIQDAACKELFLSFIDAKRDSQYVYPRHDKYQSPYKQTQIPVWIRLEYNCIKNPKELLREIEELAKMRRGVKCLSAICSALKSEKRCLPFKCLNNSLRNTPIMHAYMFIHQKEGLALEKCKDKFKDPVSSDTNHKKDISEAKEKGKTIIKEEKKKKDGTSNHSGSKTENASINGSDSGSISAINSLPFDLSVDYKDTKEYTQEDGNEEERDDFGEIEDGYTDDSDYSDYSDYSHESDQEKNVDEDEENKEKEKKKSENANLREHDKKQNKMIGNKDLNKDEEKQQSSNKMSLDDALCEKKKSRKRTRKRKIKKKPFGENGDSNDETSLRKKETEKNEVSKENTTNKVNDKEEMKPIQTDDAEIKDNKIHVLDETSSEESDEKAELYDSYNLEYLLNSDNFPVYIILDCSSVLSMKELWKDNFLIPFSFPGLLYLHDKKMIASRSDIQLIESLEENGEMGKLRLTNSFVCLLCTHVANELRTVCGNSDILRQKIQYLKNNTWKKLTAVGIIEYLKVPSIIRGKHKKTIQTYYLTTEQMKMAIEDYGISYDTIQMIQFAIVWATFMLKLFNNELHIDKKTGEFNDVELNVQRKTIFADVLYFTSSPNVYSFFEYLYEQDINVTLPLCITVNQINKYIHDEYSYAINMLTKEGATKEAVNEDRHTILNRKFFQKFINMKYAKHLSHIKYGVDCDGARLYHPNWENWKTTTEENRDELYERRNDTSGCKNVETNYGESKTSDAINIHRDTVKERSGHMKNQEDKENERGSISLKDSVNKTVKSRENEKEQTDALHVANNKRDISVNTEESATKRRIKVILKENSEKEENDSNNKEKEKCLTNEKESNKEKKKCGILSKTLSDVLHNTNDMNNINNMYNLEEVEHDHSLSDTKNTLKVDAEQSFSNTYKKGTVENMSTKNKERKYMERESTSNSESKNQHSKESETRERAGLKIKKKLQSFNVTTLANTPTTRTTKQNTDSSAGNEDDGSKHKGTRTHMNKRDASTGTNANDSIDNKNESEKRNNTTSTDRSGKKNVNGNSKVYKILEKTTVNNLNIDATKNVYTESSIYKNLVHENKNTNNTTAEDDIIEKNVNIHDLLLNAFNEKKKGMDSTGAINPCHGEVKQEKQNEVEKEKKKENVLNSEFTKAEKEETTVMKEHKRTDVLFIEGNKDNKASLGTNNEMNNTKGFLIDKMNKLHNPSGSKNVAPHSNNIINTIINNNATAHKEKELNTDKGCFGINGEYLEHGKQTSRLNKNEMKFLKMRGTRSDLTNIKEVQNVRNSNNAFATNIGNTDEILMKHIRGMKQNEDDESAIIASNLKNGKNNMHAFEEEKINKDKKNMTEEIGNEKVPLSHLCNRKLETTNYHENGLHTPKDETLSVTINSNDATSINMGDKHGKFLHFNDISFFNVVHNILSKNELDNKGVNKILHMASLFDKHKNDVLNATLIFEELILTEHICKLMGNNLYNKMVDCYEKLYKMLIDIMKYTEEREAPNVKSKDSKTEHVFLYEEFKEYWDNKLKNENKENSSVIPTTAMENMKERGKIIDVSNFANVNANKEKGNIVPTPINTGNQTMTDEVSPQKVINLQKLMILLDPERNNNCNINKTSATNNTTIGNYASNVVTANRSSHMINDTTNNPSLIGSTTMPKEQAVGNTPVINSLYINKGNACICSNISNNLNNMNMNKHNLKSSAEIGRLNYMKNNVVTQNKKITNANVNNLFKFVHMMNDNANFHFNNDACKSQNGNYKNQLNPFELNSAKGEKSAAIGAGGANGVEKGKGVTEVGGMNPLFMLHNLNSNAPININTNGGVSTPTISYIQERANEMKNVSHMNQVGNSPPLNNDHLKNFNKLLMFCNNVNATNSCENRNTNNHNVNVILNNDANKNMNHNSAGSNNIKCTNNNNNNNVVNNMNVNNFSRGNRINCASLNDLSNLIKMNNEQNIDALNYIMKGNIDNNVNGRTDENENMKTEPTFYAKMENYMKNGYNSSKGNNVNNLTNIMNTNALSNNNNVSGNSSNTCVSNYIFMHTNKNKNSLSNSNYKLSNDKFGSNNGNEMNVSTNSFRKLLNKDNSYFMLNPKKSIDEIASVDDTDIQSRMIHINANNRRREEIMQQSQPQHISFRAPLNDYRGMDEKLMDPRVVEYNRLLNLQKGINREL